MDASCPRTFDEAQLSGYLDGELTQAAEQKVRIHVEDCAHCRALLAELRAMREATMSTEFVAPDDRQWDERPRSRASLLSRGAGWALGLVWVVAVAAYGLWQLWISSAGLVEKVLAFGGLSALALLLTSVVLDRIAAARTDPYREVQR